ncbi:MAG: type VI secretion system secreted protein VgrG [Burkholderiaceae bacterium]|jgi:type VI secretion system secreted protein VgrG
MPANQTNRDVFVKSALADDVLLFKTMHCSEQLGHLFEYRIALSSSKLDIKIDDVLGKPMTVTLESDDGGPRHFNGLVTRFAYKGWRDGMASYEALVRPALWLLTRSSNCRIFQGNTAIEIVKMVCANAVYGEAIQIDVTQISATPEIRDYCVQYRESDFSFVCRLLEEEGIYFYFKHTASDHTMVLADSYGAHSTVNYYETVRFVDAGSSQEAGVEAVTKWMPRGEIQAGEYVLDDYDFEKSSSSINGGLTAKATIPAAFAQSTFEHYDYPGRYRDSSVGTALARARMESLHGQCEEINAECSVPGIACGALFTLEDHPRDDQNRTFLITSAQTELVGDDYASGGQSGGVDFRCSFTAVGNEHSYRPARQWHKPFMQGPQTAMVVGKAGEEIWTDKYGRIKVQFHWDRLGKEDEASSCWVRVSQAWAGKGWGAMFIPRIGMEVVVNFLDGDPDRPLVTGCVYNSDAMPPYALPAEQTKSVIKTNSSKGGGGYNELRFEDKKDSEEIFIQAEKDYNRVVKNNDTLKVGFEKADQGDQTIGINHDQSLEVGNDRKVKVVNDHTEEVGNNQTITIKADQKVDVAKTIVIEAGTSIELKVGSSSIKIEASKITIKSVEIAIESSAATVIKAGATMSVKAGAIMTIEGAMVKIN